MKKKILIAILAALISAGGVVGIVVFTHSGNEGDSSSHVHDFSLQNATEAYLKSEATCTTKAVYYYSCECDEKGTKTFEYGEINISAHDYSECVSNGDGTHSKTCSNDDSHIITEDCNGGIVTCTQKASCKDCGAKYGELKEHEYNQQNTDSKFIKTEATCTAKAVYYYSCTCGAKGTETFEYGEPKGHSYSATWSYNDTHHWKEDTCGCDVTNNYAIHILNGDGVCTVCYNVISETPGVSYILSDDETYYVVDDYTGTAARVRIAESYNGLPVKEIADSAFYDNTTVTEVIIPSSITAINGSAFSGCTNLTSITIPDSVTSIGSYVFYNCSKLKNITIPDSVTLIGDSAFSGFSSLASVYYAGTIDEWVQIDFSDNYSNPLYYAEKLYINNELVTEANITTATKISGYAFYNCSMLTSVTIGDGVTSIGASAFYGCSALTSVYYTETIDQWVQINFSNNSSNPLYYAKKLYINNELVTEVNITTATEISDYAFYNCSALTSITIGNGVTSIGERAFRGCSSLTSVTIPDSVTSIGDYAFYYCSALTSVTIPDSVTSIGERAFEDCRSLTSVTIPDSVTSIGDEAFRGCSALTSITIGSGVTSIGRYAFCDCSSLTSIIFNDTTTWYSTSSETNWKNKTGGTQISVTSSTNATYFKSTYYNYYWYKL